MHIKIQGGGNGKYANKESCNALVNYLQHEDLERLKDGVKMHPFFSQVEDNVSPDQIIDLMDNNKQKLCKTDAKFFMITYSPSEEEINVLGATEEEQAMNLKKFVRDGLMEQYAANFQKDLQAKDLMYFAKIHFERKKSIGEKSNTHVHILVSRKSLNGRLKLSPQTNHRNTSNGVVKGGFVRTAFVDLSEKHFDKMFNYQRAIANRFHYKNAYKQAKSLEKFNLIRLKHILEQHSSLDKDVILELCQKNGVDDKRVINLLNDPDMTLENLLASLKIIDSDSKKSFESAISNSIGIVSESPVLDDEKKKRKKKKRRFGN